MSSLSLVLLLTCDRLSQYRHKTSIEMYRNSDGKPLPIAQTDTNLDNYDAMNDSLACSPLPRSSHSILPWNLVIDRVEQYILCVREARSIKHSKRDVHPNPAQSKVDIASPLSIGLNMEDRDML